MTRKPSSLSVKQQQAQFRAAGRAYAAMAGVEPMAMDVDPVEKPRAKRGPRKYFGESEADILRAIMRLLKHHPKVAKVWRQNSGTFALQYGPKTHYFRANTARGMADIAGILKGGRSFYVEVKSATGRVQEHQQEFLDECTKGGALAFVARDVQTVIDKLEGV